MLDDDDLVMVVKEDVVKQIDEHRGELTRTEFVNHLIQYQLRQCYQEHNYVSKEEFQEFSHQVTDLMHNFLQFFLSYGMAMQQQPPCGDFNSLSQQLDILGKSDEENQTS